jgi:CubicO group peptidase (beta-lactamase class C family)
MISRNIVLLCLTLFTISSVCAQQRKTSEIDSLMRRAHRLGVFNGNVLVTDQDSTVYHVALGIADASGKTPLTEDHRFHIGSIAKEFSAVGIMLLVREKRLSLEDNVGKYLPELPSWADSIKILHILQYTSGLPDVKWKTVKSDADNMADLKILQRLNTVPGTVYAYNNNNIFIQRRIIEKISGMPFNRFVEERLLKPAGMRTAVVDPTNETPLMAKAFDDKGQQDELTPPISGQTAVTLKDLYQWSVAINSFRILDASQTRAILVPFGPNMQAGLGKGNMDHNHIGAHIHDGTGRNYQALLVSHPPKGRTVILLSNNKQDNLYDFNTAIQAILDGKPYVQPKKSAYKLLQPKLDSLNGEQLLALYQQLKQSHSGEYGFDQESALNKTGYALMSKGRIDDAITIFTYNTTLFPTSGNVFDSLGEAYYNKGNKANALLYYKQALKLDPDNAAAKRIVETLSAK